MLQLLLVACLLRPSRHNLETICQFWEQQEQSVRAVASGERWCRYAMTSITVPEPVMSLAVAPKNRESSGAFSKALNRFTKEDPTFKVGMDAESGQTIISGMGELHLDIYIERMKREYKVTLAH